MFVISVWIVVAAVTGVGATCVLALCLPAEVMDCSERNGRHAYLGNVEEPGPCPRPSGGWPDRRGMSRAEEYRAGLAVAGLHRELRAAWRPASHVARLRR